MTRSMCRNMLRVVLIAIVTVVLGVSTGAQTAPPRPNFKVTWNPQLAINLWPGDFDRDGRVDLVAATRNGGDLVIAFGRGDGTFRPPVPLGYGAIPLTVSDINADGFSDLVIMDGDALKVVPGRGDGTFAAPITVATGFVGTDPDVRRWARSADFDGDGRRDLIVPGLSRDTRLVMFSGHGDFTFAAPIDLPAAPDGQLEVPADAIDGDVNGDGRRDIVVANLCCQLTLYLSQGGGAFTRSVIDGPPGGYPDVTAGDLNGDGKLDLVVAAKTDLIFALPEPTEVDDGRVVVFLGRGDGTFLPAVEYDSGRMEISIVVGDFNRDGKLDVATGNRSRVTDGDDIFRLSDSVSILPGDGTGRLLAPVTYALSSVGPPFFGDLDPNYPFEWAQHQLNTADVNGDGKTDLISSPGAVLLNQPAAPNRAPTALPGLNRTEFPIDFFLLKGDGTDPDMNFLTYTWRDQNGQVVSPRPWVRRSSSQAGTYTLTVDDGQGGVASDSVTIRHGSEEEYVVITGPREGQVVRPGEPFTLTWFTYNPSSPLQSFALAYSVDDGAHFSPVPGCEDLPSTARSCGWSNPGPKSDHAMIRLTAAAPGGDVIVYSSFRISNDEVLSNGWSGVDVGQVGAKGSATFSNGTFTVTGSGADIWGTADEFHFAYQHFNLSGPIPGASVTVRVSSVQDLDKWVKAGIMLREDLTPGSRHVSLFATPRIERGIAFQRRTHLNGTSVHTAGPAVTAPVWLSLGINGDVVSAYWRRSATDSWTLIGRETIEAFRPAYIGLAVSSHIDGALATATFDTFSFEGGPITGALDIGAVGARGTTAFDGVTYQIEGGGADIWGTADAFRFAYKSGSATEIRAHVLSVENTDPWAKAGVMFRKELFAADSVQVMVIVSPGKGVAMQFRPTKGGPSYQLGTRSGTAPEWVRLVRSSGPSGDTFTGYSSEDGVTWERIAGIVLRESATFFDAGLAVTSHNNSTLATAVFQDVVVR